MKTKIKNEQKLQKFIKENAITLTQIEPWLSKFNAKKLSELKEIEIIEMIIKYEIIGQ